MTLPSLSHRAQALLVKLADIGVTGLYVLMPFHALMVIWLGSIFGYQDIFSLWKEVVIIGLIVLTLAVVVLRHRLRSYVRADTWLIIAMLSCGLVATLLGSGFGRAFLVGVKTTAFPLLLFLAVQLIARRFADRRIALLLMIPASIVALLALWQFVVIPTHLLTELGYNAKTIIPFQGIHPDLPFGRSFATLGGPNQLGTYMILPGMVALGYAILSQGRRQRFAAAGVYMLLTLATVTSFSRSALVGYMLASALVVVLAAPKKWRWWIAGGMVGLMAVVAFTAWFTLVTDSTSSLGRFLVRGELTAAGVVGGDEGHVSALVQGYETIRQHPFGLGFGAAGPASLNGSQPLITENWYLQIGIELGLIGLLLMLVFLVHIGVEAIRSRPHSPVHIALAGTLVGVAVAGLFLHTLTDSTLAILLFMTAGIVTARRRHA